MESRLPRAAKCTQYGNRAAMCGVEKAEMQDVLRKKGRAAAENEGFDAPGEARREKTSCGGAGQSAGA
ncbi:MAG: hypothetical protein ACLVKK_13220 [Ruthenibacterium sp.]